jgi:hypothetical protein
MEAAVSEAPDVPMLAAPDLIEPVIGFRQWRLRDDRLCSPFRDEPWDDVELHAGCDHGHAAAEIPAAGCGCGVYAFYDQPPRSASPAPDLVAGAVVLWGALQLHGGGMRASHARIVGLALPPTHGRKRRRLLAAAAYLEVPAVPFRQLRALAARHGRELPASLRPRRRMPWDA